jgi:hypothetical protein
LLGECALLSFATVRRWVNLSTPVRNRYLWTLLVVGARAAPLSSQADDALRSWAKKLMQSKPFKLVAFLRTRQ